ncbi:hypothetical protein BDZ89DRAFT_770699 [Hymenopellis radicata]|nr:hypothetical protein BDZ89DRAFT_770699 [Hymenopellis radicata]
MAGTTSDARQWSLRTTYIKSIPMVERTDARINYAPSLTPTERNPEAPSKLEPAPSLSPPPVGFTYPKGLTFNLRADNRYRAREVYAASYYPPVNRDAEIEHLCRIQSPPGTSPLCYDTTNSRYIMNPIEGMTRLYPTIPVCLDIDGNPSMSVTVAALFDILDSSIQRFPEYPKIKELSDKLWDMSWGLDGTRRPVYLFDVKRNMRSADPPPDHPYDGSSSHASTKLEGNGEGIGIPATQVDDEDAKARRLQVLQTLSELACVLAPLALSKLEFDVTTFRSLDVNAYSFGGMSPTGLTSSQWNFSSGWAGGDLGLLLGIIQGRWHVDINDDPCRWTMLVIQVMLPPGSDPGAFLLGRFGLYARVEVSPNGQVRLVLFFKGNDLHSGVAPSADAEARRAFLQDLAEWLQTVNRIVYVCYPNEAICHRRVNMATYPSDGIAIHVGNNYHFFSSEGVPALGDKTSCNIRCLTDRFMRSWNEDLLLGLDGALPVTSSLIPNFYPLSTNSDSDFITVNPLFPYSFLLHLLCLNPPSLFQ